jgi:hypothetical protein
MDYDVMDWVDGYRFIEEHACDSEMVALLEEYEKCNHTSAQSR